ncbi:MAG: ABC transporter permease [Archangium gephyra]|uniref:ABC transporter permease n=1 Tax=Archangium gephyra TaxID=48 RepID=A0A2W5TSX7_9BACT|nr:MAG: ABC transporter permease [Archangium gephyra]
MRALLDNLKLAFGTFGAHPLRTMLTLLGIVIGVSTVMTMMALLEGLRVKVNKDFSQLGANVFRVDKWPQGFRFGGGGVDWNKIARRKSLTVADKRAIAEQCPSVLRTAASSWQPGQKVRTANAETQSSVFIIGATVEYPETSGITIANGRMYNDTEELDGRRVAVLGPDVADKLFPSLDPIGQEIRLRNRPFTVVGVMERRGKLMGMFNLDNQVLVPMSTFLSQYGKRRGVSVSIEAIDREHLDKAMEEATRVMRQRREVGPMDENDFETSTNESMAKSLNDLSSVVTAATFGVCILSLIVGGIGILNIMLVSVTERTREIGIRKALGARKNRILMQFATEAIVLSLVGGVIGIAIGFGLAFLGRWTFGLYTVVPVWAVLMSLGMSSGVGLVFGIYPAARAAKLDPIEAMRAE